MTDFWPEFFIFILVFGAILYLAWLTTRYIGKKTAKALKGKLMEVIETISVGIDRQLMIVRVENEYFLIAASGKQITFLSKLELNPETAVLQSNEATAFRFGDVFEKYLSTMQNPALRIFSKKTNTSSEDPKATGDQAAERIKLIRERYTKKDGGQQ